MIRIKDVTKRVKALLQNDRLLADNDEKLITAIWENELSNLNIHSNSDIALFFSAYISHVLTPAESIRRSRQICEVAYVELRGLTYDKRHGKKAKEVKKEVQETQFEAILDGTPVYEQITPSILATLKEGQEVYFTHPEPKQIEGFYNDLQFLKDDISHGILILGAKYIIARNKGYTIDIKGSVYSHPPQAFSILKKKELCPMT